MDYDDYDDGPDGITVIVHTCRDPSECYCARTRRISLEEYRRGNYETPYDLYGPDQPTLTPVRGRW